MKENLYDPARDEQFQKPYIDIEEQRDTPEKHTYIHGGFEGTALRFSFFYPEKAAYQGRFFQFMAPAEGSEDASIGRTGQEDKIGFALTHGAYFVETNMGSTDAAGKPDSTIIYRASAVAAEYSRIVAKRLYQTGARPYGYIYGGSGGAFKTTSCFENTSAWDGAVPYIHGSPMAIPNVFCARAYAKRVLRHKFTAIVDALEPGGSGNVYEALNEEETAVLREVTRLGFPMRAWFYYKEMDDGAFPVVAKATIGVDSGYYKDFWEKEGYLGADPASSVHRDRIIEDMVIKAVHLPGRKTQEEIAAEKTKLTGADNAWKRNQDDYGSDGAIRFTVDRALMGDLYAYGTTLTITSGAAEGLVLTVSEIKDNLITLSPQFGAEHVMERLEQVREDDRVHLDNSDYLAAQTFYRHQTPPADDYVGWDQFKDESGNWKYPQRPFSVGPIIARGSCGSLQEGSFNGKMIVVGAAMDESAFPWQLDWYRNRVKQYFGDSVDDHYRLYIFDHAFHDDQAATVDEFHITSYLGGLHQALLDLSAWVEKGVEPADSSGYRIEEGQVILAKTAEERHGIQPVADLYANNGKRAEVNSKESVHFRVDIGIPEGAGTVTKIEWSFDGEDYHPGKAEEEHSYTVPGTRFAAVRVSIQRDGTDNIFTQVRNIDRARVVVK